MLPIKIRLLILLYLNDNLSSAKEIARMLDIKYNSCRKILWDLVKEEYVETSNTIRLTEKGRKYVQSTFPVITQALEHLNFIIALTISFIFMLCLSLTLYLCGITTIDIRFLILAYTIYSVISAPMLWYFRKTIKTISQKHSTIKDKCKI